MLYVTCYIIKHFILYNMLYYITYYTYMHACMHTGRQTDRHTQTDKQTDRQTDRQTDIQAGRQTVPASERRLRVKQRAVLLGIWQQDYVQNEASGDSFKCSTMCQTEVRCNAGRALKANI